MTNIPNILADRYASNAIKQIWGAKGKVKLEREYWIAVLKAQQSLGIDIPNSAISAYEKVKNEIDLDSINRREQVTRHDVKARIEEFCDLAGFEHIHKGLTSRDLTENVEQLQIIKSLQLTRLKSLSALNLLSQKAKKWSNLVMTARTHNVPAQFTTLGKRIAMFGEDFMGSIQSLDKLILSYPVRGLKGPVGTQMDLIRLFNGERDKVVKMEELILDYLGVKKVLKNVGQVYPRSLDFDVVSSLVRLSSAPSNFANTLRLMSGHELVSEGFAEGQVGSSAMPHKINSRSCERLNGFSVILSGYLTMAAKLSSNQWNEGDVSCSVVRRVFLADSFFAIDGLLDTFITVLNQMEVFDNLIEKENARYGPFLATTTILIELVKKNVGREVAHALIKEYSLSVVNDLRSGKVDINDLASRLASDSRCDMSEIEIHNVIKDTKNLIGLAELQTKEFCKMAEIEVDKFPEARKYYPNLIL